MTTSAAAESVRRDRRRAPEPTGMVADLVVFGGELVDLLLGIRFPSDRYREDPVAFCREILGVEPWSKQIEIIEAVRDHKRVAVSSGHKIGKSSSAAMLALWFYCSYPDARVVMSSTTARQVDQILWREVKMMHARGSRCVDCKRREKEARERGERFQVKRPCEHSALIDGDIGELARTGIKSEDFREIYGFTAREAEGVAGISGSNLFYIVDEASGVPQAIFDAIEGNRAGGARIVLLSNPTRNDGEFFAAFHTKAELYKTIRVSSTDTPNAVEGRDVIPGLATREWIEEKRKEWGEDSPLYLIRVEGKHALREEGKIFSVHAITEAELRWPDAPETGRLFLGLDPAGATGTGDDSAFAPRRGYKVLELLAMRGLTPEGHLVHALSILKRYRIPREIPVLVLDREGKIGAELFGLMRAHLEEYPNDFELVAVKSSDKAVRSPQIFGTVRDELASNLETWMREGGAIPSDTKLAAELHILEWRQNANAKLKVTPKDDIRRDPSRGGLGRSPDRYDAIALSCWEPLSLSEVPASAKPVVTKTEQDPPAAEQVFDPHSSLEWWR